MSEATLNAWCETSGRELIDGFRVAMETQRGTFAERESAALTLANELVRVWTQRELSRLASRYEHEVLVDGIRYRRHAEGVRAYHSLCGKVEVRRETYRQVGVHNGPTVVPLELEAGLVENATPALLGSVVVGYAAMPDREYLAQMAAAHRPMPSRSTLARISKRTGKALCAQLAIIEPVLRAAESTSARARSIVVGLDRTSMLMAEPMPALPERWLHGYKRRPPVPIKVAYRMPYIATLSLVDGDGEVVRTTRFAATAAEGPVDMMERLGAELRHVRVERPDLPVVVVQDGAPELWNLVENWLGDLGVPIAMKLIDRYHVDERLAQIAGILEGDDRARARLLAQWRDWLDTSDRAIARVCDYAESRLYELPRNTTPVIDDDPNTWRERRPRVANKLLREQADEHVRYFRRHGGKMHYKTARRCGYAIGSGPTEGACKSVVTVRCKRSSQRWFEAGASVVLQLRTLALNGRLQGAIRMHVDGARERLQVE